MNSVPLILTAILFMVLAYRFYGAFLAAKVLALSERPTPAHTMEDGQNYYPTSKWVLFGHHFAAIAGAGPLIGPVLAAQFGYAPGFFWILLGAVLAGGVHDVTILAASIRRKGRSLAEIARAEVSPLAGIVGSIAILIIIIVALAGLGLAVVNALRDSAWGTFTIAMTIPVAMVVGMWMYRFRKGHVAEASVIGVIGVFAALIIGGMIPGTRLGAAFTLSREGIVIALAAYGFIASVLPVWLLLVPRDYLSSYLKIGTVLALIAGVFIVHPTLQMPAVTKYAAGGGPVIPGQLFPFLFITIACGAISGFHALVSSGTTPKMLDRERDALPVAYGAMLMEGVVSVVALIAACSLHPADYFAINVTAEKFATLGMTPVNLDMLSSRVGEAVAGRPGGAVSLAVGFAQIFAGIPGLTHLMGYWYHFAIMFEALFILTTIDAGTRVARFLVQEYVGRVWKPMERTDWIPGSLVSSAFVVLAWGYFIWTGNVSTIWPMFGTANQLLAATALAIATAALLNAGKVRYVWVTLGPLVFVSVTTMYAGVLNITDNFLPLSRVPGKEVLGWVNVILTAVILLCVVVVLIETGRRAWRVLRKQEFTRNGQRVKVKDGAPIDVLTFGEA